jgi:hypothetical protein
MSYYCIDSRMRSKEVQKLDKRFIKEWIKINKDPNINFTNE